MPTKMSKISEAKLWPVFDEYDDMVAMCIEYTITKKKQTTYYFDCYTKDTFKSYSSTNGLYTDAEIETRPIPIGKIPAVYLWRPAPIYDGIANNRSDIELTLSRTSDVIRKNSAPIVKVVGDLIGDKPDGGEAREVYKLKQGGDVGLVSPAVSHDAIQYLSLIHIFVPHRYNSSCHRYLQGKTSKYAGVHFDKRKKKWMAQIQICGKRKFLGYYDTEKEAARCV